MAVKAVNLEAVSDLTSEAFISALKDSFLEEGSQVKFYLTMEQTLLEPIIISKKCTSF